MLAWKKQAIETRKLIFLHHQSFPKAKGTGRVLPFIVSINSNDHGRNITHFFAFIFYDILLN
jgi:hypothetical protein